MNDLLFSRIAWMNDIVLLHWMYISARDKKSFLYYDMINEIPLVFRTGTALCDTRLGLKLGFVYLLALNRHTVT